MTVRKITISIPEAALAKARREVRRGHAKSVSAYITEAVEEKTSDDASLTLARVDP